MRTFVFYFRRKNDPKNRYRKRKYRARNIVDVYERILFDYAKKDTTMELYSIHIEREVLENVDCKDKGAKRIVQAVFDAAEGFQTIPRTERVYRFLFKCMYNADADWNGFIVKKSKLDVKQRSIQLKKNRFGREIYKDHPNDNLDSDNFLVASDTE